MKKIPNDTKYFHYYNANSHNHKVGDCVIRAICTILGNTWEESYDDLTKLGRKYGRMPNDRNIIDKYLSSMGYVKQKEPRDIFNKKIRMCDFLAENPNFTAVVNLGNSHVAAVKNGKVWDIWNSSEEIIHTYYTKKDADLDKKIANNYKRLLRAIEKSD